MAGNTQIAQLETDFNQSPYWNDFDPEKDFHRVLFQPAVAVQARELTQLQDILQNQIAQFGSHIFKEGSRVKGGEFNYDNSIQYVKVNDTDSLGNTIIITNYANTILTGNTNNVTAQVLHLEDGTEAEVPNTKTFYVKYRDISAANSELKTFVAGENLNANNGFGAVVYSTDAIGNGSIFTIDSGIIFGKGHFVRHNKQTIVLDKYTSAPSYKVGFLIKEEVIDFTEDNSLYDPAQGSPNENAPGANRLKLTANLTKYPLANTVPSNFVKLFEVKNGIIQWEHERPQYAELLDELALRTYSESGDYVVKGLQAKIREHLDDGTNLGVYTSGQGGDYLKLAAGIDPGLGFIKGYEYENLVTRYIDVDKATDYNSVEGVNVSANYGNYVLCTEVVGVPDVVSGATVTLTDTAANRVSTKNYSTTGVTGATIGTAKVASIVHETGNHGRPSTQYRVYLYDIQMSNGTFSEVRSIYLNNGSLADFGADPVIDTGSGNTSLQESAFTQRVFQIPNQAIRTIRDSANDSLIDTTYEFIQKFDVTISSGGTFTVTTAGADETWPFSTGFLNNTQKNEHFTVVLNAGQTSTNLTGTIDLAASNTVNGTGTAFDTELNAEDVILADGEQLRIHSITDADTLVLAEQPSTTNTGTTFQKQYFAGEVIDFTVNGANATSRSIAINSSTLATFNMHETLSGTVSASVITSLNFVDEQETAKISKQNRFVQIRCANNTSNTVGPWCLGLADAYKIRQVRQSGSVFTANSEGSIVTNHFDLDSGQRDAFYNMAQLKKRTDSGLSISSGDYFLVELDYFTHDTSQGVGYFSVDSYPIDDVNTSNTDAIRTYEIPLFTSPTSGFVYDLRDCIDIRPTKTNTAADSTTVGGATVNPANTETFTIPAGGFHMTKPNTNFVMDLYYYLHRKDIIVIDILGNYQLIKGNPSQLPTITPKAPELSMLVASLELPPYPTLSPHVAKRSGRPFYGVKINQLTHRRYTMRDIGTIDQRVRNLEYYTTLDLLEKNAQDLLILDDNGLDRFKNGLLVDNFTGHSIGDVDDVDYTCSIDPDNLELRPRFELHNTKLEYNDASTGVYRSSNDSILTLFSAANSANFTNGEFIYQGASVGAAAYGTLRHFGGKYLYIENVNNGPFSNTITIKGNTSGAEQDLYVVWETPNTEVVTLPYSHDVYINQEYASTTRNCAGLFWNWKGFLTVVPESDYWADTTTNPDVVVNFNGNADNWDRLSEAFGTEWGSWSNTWTGRRRRIGSSSAVTGVRVRTQNDWNATRIGTTTTTTRTNTFNQQVGQSRTGTRTVIIPETITESLGERVVNVSVQPWIRSQVLGFRADGMKPNAQLYMFFDGTDMSEYVYAVTEAEYRRKFVTNFTPFLDSGVTYSNVLTTNANGVVHGMLSIPNNSGVRFHTGERLIRLSDSPTNSQETGQVTTAAEWRWSASGLLQNKEETVVNLTLPQVSSQRVQETRVINRRSTTTSQSSRTTWVNIPRDTGGGDNGDDPIAQSFVCHDENLEAAGMFLTKVDLFFQNKHEFLPIFLEIREMETQSMVTQRIVSYGQAVIYPDDINTSDDGSVATQVHFPNPVYLERGKDYALTLIPGANNPDYITFVSVLGETDLITSSRIIAQPFVGMLFASANDRTYTPMQTEDLKFNLYIANFETEVDGVLRLDNRNAEYFTIANTDGRYDIGHETVHGEPRLVLTTTPTANVGEIIVGDSSGANGIITSISSNTYRLRDVSANTKFANAETLTFLYSQNSSPTGATGTIHSQTTPEGVRLYFNNNFTSNTQLHLEQTANGTFVSGEQLIGQSSNTKSYIATIQNLRENVLNMTANELKLPRTNISWSTKATSNSFNIDTNWTSIENNEDLYFTTENMLLSKSNEDTHLSGDASLRFRAIMQTDLEKVSPVIDITRSSAFIVGNIINNDATGETNPSGGNAKARYITRTVTLGEGQDAEDLKVFITGYRPTSTEIRIYYKIQHAEDADLLEDKNWVQMSLINENTTFSDIENREDFREVEYGIAEANLTGPNLEVQYVNSAGVTFDGFKRYKIKIVMLSPNSSLVPRIKDLRVIALQK